MAHSKSPAVSVIIPTHNRAHIIPQTIDSVLTQTFRDFEIIVIDDGSTDDTSAVLQHRYGERIACIRIQNSGLPAARNRGITAARGQYIAFLDDDDAWLPDKLKLQTTLMQKSPSLGLVYCGSYTIAADDTVISETRPLKRGELFQDLLRSNDIVGSASAVLVAGSVFSKAGCFDENLTACEDWDMWIRIARDYPIDFIDKPLVKVRRHPASMQQNILNMEQATFSVLNKYWTEQASEQGLQDKKRGVYSAHCVNFAWKYYAAGDMRSFSRLLNQALECHPLHTICTAGDDLPAKEKAVLEVYRNFWNSHPQLGALKGKALAQYYRELGWAYYGQGDVKNFRRCIRRAWRSSFPDVPVRLLLPFTKSFLGKGMSERIHAIRKKLTG
jgi:glycosyltransferase involved in cell wall biosynthesis